MRGGGVEPPPGKGLDPKSSASASSAILAVRRRRPLKACQYRKRTGKCQGNESLSPDGQIELTRESRGYSTQSSVVNTQAGRRGPGHRQRRAPAQARRSQGASDPHNSGNFGGGKQSDRNRGARPLPPRPRRCPTAVLPSPPRLVTSDFALLLHAVPLCHDQLSEPFTHLGHVQTVRRHTTSILLSLPLRKRDFSPTGCHVAT